METEQITTQEVFEPTIEDMIQTESGIPTTTSLDISQAIDKEHRNVLQSIENLECSEEFRLLNFQHTPYIHPQNGQTYPAYRLTRDGFAFLAMGFTGKKAAAWKERFLEAFNAMEAALLRQQRQREAARLRQHQRQETNPKELEQPVPRPWEKPEFFRSARKLTKAQTESLLGVLNMECLLQNRQLEDALKELLTFFHLSSLEDMRQSDYRHAVFSVMKRMLLISGKTSEDAQASPQYAAAIDGLINFWNHSSDFTKGDIQNYIQNKCGLSLQEGISSDSDGRKVLFTLWGGISDYDLRLN